MIEWVKDKLRDFMKPQRDETELLSPFAEYRMPWFTVGVPRGKKAPRYAIINAVDGVAEFVRIYPWATDEEVASVMHAFEYAFAPAIKVIPAYQ